MRREKMDEKKVEKYSYKKYIYICICVRQILKGKK